MEMTGRIPAAACFVLSGFVLNACAAKRAFADQPMRPYNAQGGIWFPLRGEQDCSSGKDRRYIRDVSGFWQLSKASQDDLCAG